MSFLAIRIEKEVGEVVNELRKVVGRNLSTAVLTDSFLKHSEIIKKEMVSLAPIRGRARRVGALKGRRRTWGRSGAATKIALPGTLKRSITVFPGDGIVYIGPRRKKARHGDKTADGYYGYWQAYGTTGPKGPKNLQSPDFIMKAYRNKRSAVVEAVKKDMLDNIKKANQELHR